MKIIQYKKIPNNLGHTLSVLNKSFYAFWDKDCVWFRVFNKYGLHAIYRTAQSYIPFSERMGSKKSVKVFGWTIKLLK